MALKVWVSDFARDFAPAKARVPLAEGQCAAVPGDGPRSNGLLPPVPPARCRSSLQSTLSILVGSPCNRLHHRRKPVCHWPRPVPHRARRCTALGRPSSANVTRRRARVRHVPHGPSPWHTRSSAKVSTVQGDRSASDKPLRPCHPPAVDPHCSRRCRCWLRPLAPDSTTGENLRATGRGQCPTVPGDAPRRDGLLPPMPPADGPASALSRTGRARGTHVLRPR